MVTTLTLSRLFCVIIATVLITTAVLTGIYSMQTAIVLCVFTTALVFDWLISDEHEKQRAK
ncbi:hypothetical protein ACWOAH_09840 [Vagococcus vulneris]|uniref:Uncharacterized protein n=1 Tax=Vagococcus vulneris TaxID=1977869 RepID=A0A429ZWW1_9ENTE|nr:hypothetical protein [Vagococcus vulneris]RST98283.1 hypothetical protein CBF37_08205 [Vagococcus vulneris]